MVQTTTIHPTAVVDPKAEIGEGVEIGPYCVIYAGVEIGDGCWLQNHVTIDGPTKVGRENRFYAGSCIGGRTQDLKYEGEPTYLEIGDGNVFREYCTVNRATAPGGKTIVGNQGNFLAYAHIAHDCIVGDHVIFSNNGTLAGHVTMGDHAILGGLTAVHQFCRIGAHAITGGCSKIVKDVPPYMIADGNPAQVRAVNVVGLQRRGFDEAAIRLAKVALRKLYREKINVSEALKQLEDLDDQGGILASVIDFVRGSERGIH